MIESDEIIVDINTGTVFEISSKDNFRVVSIKKHAAIDKAEAIGGGQRYDMMFYHELIKHRLGCKRFKFSLHRLVVGCILRHPKNFPKDVTRFEGDHALGGYHAKKRGQ